MKLKNICDSYKKGNDVVETTVPLERLTTF